MESFGFLEWATVSFEEEGEGEGGSIIYQSNL